MDANILWEKAKVQDPNQRICGHLLGCNGYHDNWTGLLDKTDCDIPAVGLVLAHTDSVDHLDNIVLADWAVEGSYSVDMVASMHLQTEDHGIVDAGLTNCPDLDCKGKQTEASRDVTSLVSTVKESCIAVVCQGVAVDLVWA